MWPSAEHIFSQAWVIITLANLYTQIDEYIQEIQYWGYIFINFTNIRTLM